MIPSRDMEQYTSVENFAPYELTTCIAYELAIRNGTVVTLVKNAINTYLDKDTKNTSTPTLELKYSGKYFKELEEKYYIPQWLYISYYFFEAEEKKLLNAIEQDKKQKDIKHKLYCKFKELETSSGDSRLEKEKLWNEYNQLEPYSVFAPENILFQNSEIDFNDTVDYDSTQHRISEKKTNLYKDSLASKEDNEHTTITDQRIEPVYSRPKLRSFFKSYERDFRLNLALPKKELIDFIERIKVEFDADHTILKTPLELLGEELDEDNNNAEDWSAIDWADTLFIYDYLKESSNTKTKAVAELVDIFNNHHGRKVEKVQKKRRTSL